MNLDKISEKIAKELNISEHEVKRVNRSQYKFLLDTIQAGNFDSVKLLYLGKFFKNKRYERQTKTTGTDIRGMEEPSI